jgi:aryl-alcohol dehydrogenase-like predicted oxidoreductase
MALTDEMFNQLEQIKVEAQKQGHTLLQHALKSLLETPAVLSLVVGVKTIPQLERLIIAIDKS